LGDCFCILNLNVLKYLDEGFVMHTLSRFCSSLKLARFASFGIVVSVLVSGLFVPSSAQTNGATSPPVPSNIKTLQLVNTNHVADGKTSIHREVLESCVEKLPAIKDLQVDAVPRNLYLKNIMNDPNREGMTKTWTAEVTIPWMLRQKVLLVISSNNVNSGDPRTETIERKIPQSTTVSADPQYSDFFAGMNPRTFHFSDSATAANFALRDAQKWLQKQKPLQCSP